MHIVLLLNTKDIMRDVWVQTKEEHTEFQCMEIKTKKTNKNKHDIFIMFPHTQKRGVWNGEKIMTEFWVNYPINKYPLHPVKWKSKAYTKTFVSHLALFSASLHVSNPTIIKHMLKSVILLLACSCKHLDYTVSKSFALLSIIDLNVSLRFDSHPNTCTFQITSCIIRQ